MEEIVIMVEELKKKLSNPDSIVSLFLGAAVVIVVGVMIANYLREKQPENLSKTEQQKMEASATASAQGSTYTVTAGESLWSIAAKTIGSGYNWVDIKEANNLESADVIEVGQKLTIPKVAKREPGQIANAMVETKRPADGKYTVKKGDSLWNISVEVYGTGFRWTEIAKANNIAEPNMIFTGNVLLLP